ncbi:MAG: ABC transporter ATP-binding protein [Gemmatimonadaceae bacterium]
MTDALMVSGPSASPVVAISGLAKRYSGMPVLQDVGLALGRGRTTAILGPNGAGKTTLIKMILGLARPDSGEMLLDGRPLGSDPSLRAGIGYMPQIARFPENLTGAELIAMLVDLRGPTATLDRELVDRFRLGAELTKPLRTLSGGTRQKVNAVLAFLFAPRLLILDEPTAGLDPIASGVLKDKILEERGRGKTFLLTSHIMSELEELADDVVFLLDGAVRFAGSLHELKIRTRQLSLQRAVAHLMREDGEAA